MKRVFLSITLIAIFVIACGKDPVNPSDTDNSIKPLYNFKVGNSWVYKTTNYNLNGSVSSTLLWDNYIVDSTSMFNQKKWYHFKSQQDNKWEMYLRYDSLGLYHYFTDGSQPTNELFSLKYPVKKGDKFTILDKFNTNYEVLSVDTILTVPAGKFHCILYLNERRSNSSDDNYAYYRYLTFYSAGTGLVAIYDYYRFNDTDSWIYSNNSELISYSF